MFISCLRLNVTRKTLLTILHCFYKRKMSRRKKHCSTLNTKGRCSVVDSEKCRTPVKIQRFTYTSDGEKIIINDMTKISVPGQTQYSFQFKVSLPSHTQLVSIEEIVSRSNEWDNVTQRQSCTCLGHFNGWCEAVKVGGDYVCRFHWNCSCRYMGTAYSYD